MKVRLNQELIFVAIKDRIFLYHLDGMRFLTKLELDNHLGRIALSPYADANPYMVYSQSLKEGSLVVFDTTMKKVVNMIKCHKTPILKLAISAMGNMVATCSTQGQMIRVFSIPNGEKLFTFTRGIKNTTQYSLNFSNDSSFLLSSSDTGTIHVFQLVDHKNGSNTKGGHSIVEEQKVARVPNSGGGKWFNFLVPKTCDDFMSA